MEVELTIWLVAAVFVLMFLVGWYAGAKTSHLNNLEQFGRWLVGRGE